MCRYPDEWADDVILIETEDGVQRLAILTNDGELTDAGALRWIRVGPA